MRVMKAMILGVALASAPFAIAGERSVVLTMGKPAGFQQAEYSDDGALSVHYEYNDRGRGPKLDSSYRIGADGLIGSLETHGLNYFKGQVSERYTLADGKATWQNDAEDESRKAATPAFYLGLQSPPEEGTLLARALLRAPDHKLALLPAGEASIERIAELKVRGKAGARTVTLYAISGLDLTPSYLWLDETQRFFASYSPWQAMVREGYEEAIPELGKRQDAETLKLETKQAHELTTELSTAIAIAPVRVFDSETGKVADDQVVVVAKGRVTAVGKRGETAVPDGARSIDGKGQFLMPGLWDMHAHYSGGYEGVLDIASGVTTVRDLANDADALSANIKRIETGDAIGPRIIKAGFVDGRGPYAGPTKVFVDDEAEARSAVEHYAKTGYEQIKIYSSIKPALMPVIARLPHEHGLRVSGHVPAFMSARQFVEGGADEIQHINFIVMSFVTDVATADTRTPLRFTSVAQNAAALDLSAAPIREFVDFLAARGTVVDPTISTFENMFLEQPGHPGPSYAAWTTRVPPTWRRSLAAGTGGLEMKREQEVTYRDSYQRLIDMVGMLHRSGVRIVAGTDGIGGLQLVRELELYVAAGIPPAEALRIATRAGADTMKRGDTYGRVAPGYVADLMLVEGDPTINIGDLRKVRTVIKGDRMYDSDALYRAVGINPNTIH